MRLVIVAILLVATLAPPAEAAACDYKIGETAGVIGTYVLGQPEYARAFVFAVQLDCGTRELVTVQRATGALPVCKPQERVEVVGKLTWNKFLIDGHYEINNPSSVTCLPQAAVTTAASPPQPVPAGQPAPGSRSAPSVSPVSPQAPPLAKAAPAQAPARNLGPSVWIGRYQDSRGAGDVTLTVVWGASTVSGTWKMRTGGGGPITGLLDGTGRRMQLRMENIAPECPGTFEGSADIREASILATYRGNDCEGAVTQGTLELRPQ